MQHNVTFAHSFFNPKSSYMKKLLLLLLLLPTSIAFAATRTAVANGNWSTASTWGGTLPGANDVAIIPAGITVTQNVSGTWTNPATITVLGTLIFQGNEPKLATPCTLEVQSGGLVNDKTIGNQLYFAPTSFIKVVTGGRWSSTGEYETLFYNFNASAEYQTPLYVMDGPFQISVYTNQVTYSTTVLPLKLISFSGKKSSVNNILSWQTAGEQNTDAFFVERSTDAIKFETLGKVTAKGTPGENHYSFTDRSALKGNNFYRLKMTDLDGTFSYSEIPVNIKRDGNFELSIYPSPADQIINISTAIAGKLSIYNSLGKLVYTQHLTAGKFPIDIGRLATGTYYAEQAGQRSTFIKVAR